jgi:hypothetical protein
VVTEVCGHCWGNAQGLVKTAVVIEHVVQSYGMRVIFYFLAESVGQAREAAHMHPHGQVLPLHK